MSASPQVALSGLARALVQHGRLMESEALSCTTPSGNPNEFIIEAIKRGLISAAEVARFSAATFGYPLLDLGSFDEAHFALDAIDRKLMAKHQAVPLGRRGNRLTLAMADPSNLRVLDEIRFQSGLAVDPVVVEAPKLVELVERLSESASTVLKDMTGDEFDMDLLGKEGASEAQIEDVNSEVDDAPVVRFIQKLLIDAINEGASDVHFEPYEKYYRIRFRTDGILREIAQPPLVLKEKIAARIKVISRLDISEKRVPQDGRMKLVLSKNKAIDFRVSTLPTLHGEKIVMRILDPTSAMLGIDALGYDPDQREALLAAVERPYGMVLVTGPTGSGKTVS
ncbi:MAG TPA: ATPase, T2SS/T4P/T4SS family, partial [Zoogloea sp.]